MFKNANLGMYRNIREKLKYELTVVFRRENVQTYKQLMKKEI